MSTENTTEAVKFPEVLNNFVPKTLTIGDHPATVLGIRVTANYNGKPFVEVDCDLGGMRRQHQMYVSTPAAAANTAKQLNRAFGITSFSKDNLAGAVGQKCSLRAQEEEYNGKTSIKTVFLNPYSDVEVDMSSLDDAFNAPAEPVIAF